jgi:ribosomal protein S18 acetylase RimI-like enzyme
LKLHFRKDRRSGARDHHSAAPAVPNHVGAALRRDNHPAISRVMRPNEVTTRAFRESDYDAVVELWRTADGVEVAEGDSREEIAAYLKRNPNLSRVTESGGELVGAVLCGHDGHRGIIYHLAVAPSHRGQGIGRQLIEEGITGLRTCGIVRALLLVAKDNEGGVKFWQSLGFEPVSHADAYGIDIL